MQQHNVKQLMFTAEVESLLKVNYDNIKKVFEKYSGKPQGKFDLVGLNLAEIKEMLVTSDLKLSKRNIGMLTALSKQTVIEDNIAKGAVLMQNLVFVEFLEFIGRLAVCKFLGTELEGEPLAVKIGYILDELFEPLGLVKNLPVSTFDEETTSDDDY